MLENRILGPIVTEKNDRDGAVAWNYRLDAVSLNIDDFREIEAIVKTLGLTVNRQAGPWDASPESSLRVREHSGDVGAANPRLVGQTTITAFDSSVGSAGGQLNVHLTPLDLSVWANGGSAVPRDDLRRAVQDVARVMEGGRRRLPPTKAAQILIVLLTMVFVAIWVWVAVASQSLPTAVVGLGVLLLAMRGHATRIGAVERWWQRRGPATWLDAKSRAELATERANTRRDWRVGLLTGVGGAVLGSILGAILQARLSR